MPFITQLLVTLSESMFFLIPVVGVLIFLASVWWRKNGQDPRVREVVDPLKLKLPGIGTLFHKIALARFTRNLSLLMHAGVPVLEALEMTAGTVGNIKMARAIRAAAVSVRDGGQIATPLREEALFPPMVVRQIAVGEENGRIDVMLSKSADYYDQEVETAAKAMQSLIEPLMIVAVGGIVGFIAIAMYAPYLSVGELITE